MFAWSFLYCSCVSYRYSCSRCHDIPVTLSLSSETLNDGTWEIWSAFTCDIVKRGDEWMIFVHFEILRNQRVSQINLSRYLSRYVNWELVPQPDLFAQVWHPDRNRKLVVQLQVPSFFHQVKDGLRCWGYGEPRPLALLERRIDFESICLKRAFIESNWSLKRFH